MSGPITRIFMQVGTVERDHPWYQCSREGACEELSDAPAPWAWINEVTTPRQTAIVLYCHRLFGPLAWGVAWGPMPSGERDRFGREAGFRLLVEFAEAAEAGVFCAGALRDWWPHRTEGISNLGNSARQATRESRTGGGNVEALLLSTLRQWQADQATISGSRAVGQEPSPPRIARLHADRLCDLQRCLLDASLWEPLAADVGDAGFRAVIVVTEGVVASRLRSVWRALTDDERIGSCWDAVGVPRPLQRRPNSTDTPVRPGQFRRGFERLRANRQPPDGGRAGKHWRGIMRAGIPERIHEAIEALVYRAINLDKYDGIVPKLVEELEQPRGDWEATKGFLTVLQRIADHGIRLTEDQVGRLIPVLNALVQGLAPEHVREAAGELKQRLPGPPAAPK